MSRQNESQSINTDRSSAHLIQQSNMSNFDDEDLPPLSFDSQTVISAPTIPVNLFYNDEKSNIKKEKNRPQKSTKENKKEENELEELQKIFHGLETTFATAGRYNWSLPFIRTVQGEARISGMGLTIERLLKIRCLYPDAYTFEPPLSILIHKYMEPKDNLSTLDLEKFQKPMQRLQQCLLDETEKLTITVIQDLKLSLQDRWEQRRQRFQIMIDSIRSSYETLFISTLDPQQKLNSSYIKLMWNKYGNQWIDYICMNSIDELVTSLLPAKILPVVSTSRKSTVYSTLKTSLFASIKQQQRPDENDVKKIEENTFEAQLKRVI